MKLLGSFRLKTKLLGGFLLVSAITAVVGAIGYFSVGKLAAQAKDVGEVRLASVRSLMHIKSAGEQLKSCQRTMLVLGLDPAVRARQFDRVAEIRESYGKAWELYESLPHGPEEKAAWDEFAAEWKAWRDVNNRFFQLARDFEKLDIANPYALERDLERFRGDHHKLTQRMLAMIQTKEAFEGGEDHQACSFGRWIDGLRTKNPDLAAAAKASQEPHHKFHAAVARAKAAFAQGDATKGQAIVLGEMVSAAEAVFVQLERIRDLAKAARELEQKAQHEAVDVVRAHQIQANDLLDKLIAMNNELADQAVARGQTLAGQAKLLAAGASVGGVILAVALGFYLSSSITGPILRGVAFAKNMAQGDMTQTLQIDQQDEIGDLARALNGMAASLRTMFGDVAENATSLTQSSSSLTSTATQLAAGAEQTTAQSATIAAAAEEMSTNMTNVAASSEEMSSNVRVVASAVEELTASISEVAKSAEQAASVARNAAQLADGSNVRIGELGNAADEIGKVIEVIQDIAEQTNLLALNATIEAARAGEAGKGFAVVATEVKELARQTATATEDIRKRIEGIQGSTGEAVRSIGEIGEVIQRVNEVSRTIASAVEEQSITTKEIAQNMAQTSSAAAMVSQGVAESASASQEITRNLSGVDVAAKQAAHSASETQTASQALSQLADRLQSLVGGFRI